MKKKLIVYDSVFGNTEQIAQAVAAGLGDADVLKIVGVTPTQLTNLDLLVVGSPTRGFHATPAMTKFLKKLPPHGLKNVQVAAFDTRFTEAEIASAVFFLKYLVKLFGYAADPIAKWLQKKGGKITLPAEGFFVKGTEGPLIEGELKRAKNWGSEIEARRSMKK